MVVRAMAALQRQNSGWMTWAVIIDGIRQGMLYWEGKREGLEMSAVSYTHLTLPTKRIV